MERRLRRWLAAALVGGALAAARPPGGGDPAAAQPAPTPTAARPPGPAPTQTPFGSGLPAGPGAPGVPEVRPLRPAVAGALRVPFVVAGEALPAGEPVEIVGLPAAGGVRSAGGTVVVVPAGTVVRFPARPRVGELRVAEGAAIDVGDARALARLLPHRLPATGGAPRGR
jgi:hypothetical protein